MKRSISLLAALIAVVVVGSAMASVALAEEPNILYLSGEAAPVVLSGESTETATELQNSAGKITGTGYKLKIEEAAGGAKEYHVDFTNVAKGAQSCFGGGDTGSTVLVSGKYKLVFDSLAGSPELGVAALFEVPALEVTCGATIIKISGNVLGLVKNIKSEGTAFKGILHCSSTVGTPAEEKYWEGGVEKSALLLANFGTGLKKACENIAGEVPLTASKMIEIMG